MDRRTRENLLYVAEEASSRLGKRFLVFLVFLIVGIGILWGLQRVDAYLTPSFANGKVLQAEASAELRETRIFIPNIGVEAPIAFVKSVEPQDFLDPLKHGVAHYPSALPGEKGTAIILGHSAPFGWFGNKYDGIFSNLKDLEAGDTVSLFVGEKEYTYAVQEKRFLARGQDIPQELQHAQKARLVLLSCWPPGINNKRIMVQAELVNF